MSTDRSPPPRPWPDCPLVVAYGLGGNSTAMLVEFARRHIQPDLILFADTGGEKPETYGYLDVIQPWLKGVGFPPVVTVRYQPKRAAYRMLEEQCLHIGTLPSLAYGGKSCSLKYKRSCQDKLILELYPEPRMRSEGRRVVRAIGYDVGETRRVVKAIGIDAKVRRYRDIAISRRPFVGPAHTTLIVPSGIEGMHRSCVVRQPASAVLCAASRPAGPAALESPVHEASEDD